MMPKNNDDITEVRCWGCAIDTEKKKKKKRNKSISGFQMHQKSERAKEHWAIKMHLYQERNNSVLEDEKQQQRQNVKCE